MEIECSIRKARSMRSYPVVPGANLAPTRCTLTNQRPTHSPAETQRKLASKQDWVSNPPFEEAPELVDQ